MRAAILGYAERVTNYVAALEAVGVAPLVTLSPAEAADCAGLLLPGGGDVDPARFGQPDRGSRDIDLPLDEAQLTALDLFVKAGKPVLGICRGHQVLNIYFGGDLIQDLPTANAHMATEHDDRLHPAALAPGSLLHRLYGDTAPVNSAHHQGLDRIGAGLKATAWAPDGVIEAIEHETLPILGVQFHPERMTFAHARPETVNGAPIFEWFRSMLASPMGGEADSVPNAVGERSEL